MHASVPTPICVTFTMFRVIIDIPTDFPSCCRENGSFIREEMIFLLLYNVLLILSVLM